MRAVQFGFEHRVSDANPFYRLAQGVDAVHATGRRCYRPGLAIEFFGHRPAGISNCNAP